MTELCYVYWIRTPGSKDPFAEGYIGITKNLNKRFSEHRRSARKGSNYIVHKAIKKYGWSGLQASAIAVSSIDSCKEQEILLRPSENIGWNICAGGVRPVQQSLEYQRKHWERTLKDIPPTKHTQEFKNNLTDRNHKYLYTIWNKEGYKVEDVRLWEWCKENNIRQSCMQRVATGQRKHHKGFYCLRSSVLK
jgi:predicted GIY-YIG superfamily endonuclease